jgi:hypothetical protein
LLGSYPTNVAENHWNCNYCTRSFVLGLAAAIKSEFHVSVIILVRFPVQDNRNVPIFPRFVGIICARLGGNNKPTVLQFKYALRRLLARNQHQGNNLSNVQPIATTIGSVFGLIPVKKVFVDEEFLKDGSSDSLLNKTIAPCGKIQLQANGGCEKG